MSKKLRIGIIGCGGIAENKHLPSLAKLENVEIVAFCDIIKERAEKLAAKFGNGNAEIYEDYNDLLKDESIDAVNVLTPNYAHAPATVAALTAGKHVMCEKPMAKTYAEALEMLEAAKKSGKKLTIGYQNRFRSDSMYLKSACERGDLGEIYYAKAHAVRRRAVPTWGVFLKADEQGGGPLIDIGTHALDLTLWMMNNYKPKSVMGTTYKKLSDNPDCGNAFGPWNPKEYTVEDSAFGFITMQDGATIILESSWALNTLDKDEAMTTLCGTKAGADMRDGLRINGDEFGKLYTKKPALSAEGVDFFFGETEDISFNEAKSWIDAILDDTDPLVKPEEAIVVTQILEAIYESARTGKVVNFDDSL